MISFFGQGADRIGGPTFVKREPIFSDGSEPPLIKAKVVGGGEIEAKGRRPVLEKDQPTHGVRVGDCREPSLIGVAKGEGARGELPGEQDGRGGCQKGRGVVGSKGEKIRRSRGGDLHENAKD